jgi:hypothetical protein
MAGLGWAREVDRDLEYSNRSRAEPSRVTTLFTRPANKIRVKLAICVRMKHGVSPFQLAPLANPAVPTFRGIRPLYAGPNAIGKLFSE